MCVYVIYVYIKKEFFLIKIEKNGHPDLLLLAMQLLLFIFSLTCIQNIFLSCVSVREKYTYIYIFVTL